MPPPRGVEGKRASYAKCDEAKVLERAGIQMRWQLYVPAGIFQRLITQPSRLLLFEIGLMFVLTFPVAWVASRYLAVSRRKRSVLVRGGQRMPR